MAMRPRLRSRPAPIPRATVAGPPVPECHPHLFVRTHEIIGRVNRHFFKHLHHVEELIANNPLARRRDRTWENVRGGLDRKFTMTRTANADGSVTFDFELDVAQASQRDPASSSK